MFRSASFAVTTLFLLTLASIAQASTLYGSNGSNRYFSINPADGAITDINANTNRSIGTMTFDSSGMLYGVSNGGTNFFSIDPTTGNTTDILLGTARSIHAMAYDPVTDTLYGANTGNRFFSIDPSDGTITDINTNVARNVGALAFVYAVPEPSSFVLAGCGAFLLAGALWRQR